MRTTTIAGDNKVGPQICVVANQTWKMNNKLLTATVMAIAATTAINYAAERQPLPALSMEGVTLTADWLPAGRITLAEQAWDLPKGQMWPVGSKGIAVNATATTLHFLHTFQPGRGIQDYWLACAVEKRKQAPPPAPPVVFSYRVNYEGGESLTVPVRWGDAVESWYRVGTVPPMLWAQPVVMKTDKVTTEQIVLYAMAWPNPWPEKRIASVDIVSGDLPWLSYGTPVILGVTASSKPATGKTFYVAPPPAGDDANAGTFEKPWETLAKGFATVQAGDTLYLRGGTYPITRKVVLANSGTIGKWITISAYPGETPVVDAAYAPLDRANKGDNWDPRGTGSGNPTVGAIHIPGQSYVRVQGLTLINSRRCGIAVEGPDKNRRGEYVDFSFNTIHRSYGPALYLHGTDHITAIGNVLVKPNTPEMAFDMVTGVPLTLPENPQEALDLSGNSFYELAFNEIYGGEKEAIDVISTDRGTIHHNYIHQNISGIYLDSWSREQHDLQVFENWMQAGSGIWLANEGGGSFSNVTLHHNVIWDARGPGLSVAEASYKAKPAERYCQIQVFNNTVWHCGHPWVRGGWGGGGIFVGSGHAEKSAMRDIIARDNIIADNAHFQLGISGFANPAARNIRIERNLIYPATGVPPAGSKKRPPVFNGDKPVLAAPAFVNAAAGDFRLRHDSATAGLGAIPVGMKLRPGFDNCGRVLFSYPGEMQFEPVEIPRQLLNIRLTRLREGDGWFFKGIYGEDLRRLPAGEQALAGVVWRIADSESGGGAAAIALKALGSQATVDAVRGIPVGRPAEHLFFLHTFNRSTAKKGKGQEATLDANPVVCTYVVNYADGQKAEIPVKYRVHLALWNERGNVTNLPAARVAWTINSWNRKGGGAYTPLAVYSMDWKNPRPTVPIAMIDIVSANTKEIDYGSPAVLAITTGRALPMGIVGK